MTNKAFLVSVSLSLAASLPCAAQSPLEAETIYPTANTQMFDATPIGGEVHHLAFTRPISRESSGRTTISEQLFDPEVIGGQAFHFADPSQSIADNIDPTREGRSAATNSKRISPTREPNGCGLQPSFSTASWLVGSL